MKAKLFLMVVSLLLIINAFGQESTIELTFNAIDSAAYIQLDSIKVMNRTQGGDTVLHWPDTVFVLAYLVEIHENSNDAGNFKVFQNYPNPFTHQTTISMYVPEKDEVRMIVTDMLGRAILMTDRVLDKGTHLFRFTTGQGRLFFFTAQWRGMNSTIKILQTASNFSTTSSLQYQGSEATSFHLKAKGNIQGFPFNSGDELLYIGYVDTLQSGIHDTQVTSETFTFQFATNIPCPGTPTVIYEGQVYNTIQILSQCWLKENLNTGTMIEGDQEMTNNGVLEKYCYNNDTNNCITYGGLYQWDEMMQYNTQQGVQGICPSGWHLPTDDEWKVLEGIADSQYGIGDQIWNTYGLRGYDAGKNLKTTSEWYSTGNGTDLFGFSGLPGGYRYSNGYFYYRRQHGLWWTSTEGNSNSAWNRYFSYNNPKVDRDYGDNKGFSFSVRCIRNN